MLRVAGIEDSDSLDANFTAQDEELFKGMERLWLPEARTSNLNWICHSDHQWHPYLSEPQVRHLEGGQTASELHRVNVTMQTYGSYIPLYDNESRISSQDYPVPSSNLRLI